MNATEPWTIGRLLSWTTEYLRKHGSASARLDAEVLLSHARGCQRIELYTDFGEEPSESARDTFREMVRRRAEGTPVAYLVGYKEFYSATFEVTPDVLIPRPETEHLVVEALDRAKQLAQDTDRRLPLRIADVGSGSGNIAVTMAQQFPDCHVTAIDISPAALAVTHRNFERHRISSDRFTLLEADLFSRCQPGRQFDLILSNPPYVSGAEYEQLDSTVRDYEPREALLAGNIGCEVIGRLLTESLAFLIDGGYLLCELSPMLTDRVRDLIGSEWRNVQFVKDLAGHERLVCLQRKSETDEKNTGHQAQT